MKTSTIVIVLGVLVAAILIYLKFFKKPANNQTTSKSAVIPDEVQKHLADFDEGGKMNFGNNIYEVHGGEWIPSV